ncbi:hypothetical protein FQZ97_986510 [compost metagenome]
MFIIQVEYGIFILRKHITGKTHGYRPPFFLQLRFYLPDRRRKYKLQCKSAGLTGFKEGRSRFIPLLHPFPFCFGMCLAVDHPFVKAFKNNTAGGRVVIHRAIRLKPCIFMG